MSIDCQKGAVKEKYKPKTIGHLKANIRDVIAEYSKKCTKIASIEWGTVRAIVHHSNKMAKFQIV